MSNSILFIFFYYKTSVLQRYFPDTGKLEKGQKADIAVIDYIPKTAININNIISHLIFGAKTGKAYITVSEGKILFKDGKIAFLNEEDLIKKSKNVVKKLHERFSSFSKFSKF